MEPDEDEDSGCKMLTPKQISDCLARLNEARNAISSKIEDNHGLIQNKAITNFNQQKTYNRRDIENSYNDNSSYLSTIDNHSIKKWNSDNSCVDIRKNVGNRIFSDSRVNVEISGGNISLNNVTFNNCQVSFNRTIKVRVQRHRPSFWDFLFKEGYLSDDD